MSVRMPENVLSVVGRMLMGIWAVSPTGMVHSFCGMDMLGMSVLMEVM